MGIFIRVCRMSCEFGCMADMPTFFFFFGGGEGGLRTEPICSKKK